MSHINQTIKKTIYKSKLFEEHILPLTIWTHKNEQGGVLICEDLLIGKKTDCFTFTSLVGRNSKTCILVFCFAKNIL